MKRVIPEEFELISKENPLEFKNKNGNRILIYIIDQEIIRVQHIIPNKQLPKTIIPSNHNLIHQFNIQQNIDSKIFIIETVKLILTINYQKDFKLNWADKDTKQVFLKDLDFRAYEYDKQMGAHHYLSHLDGTNYYGLGERTSPITLNNRHCRLSCVDAMGYKANQSDPLYKHISFYMGLNSKSKLAYGIYYNNLSTGSVDFGCEIDAFWGPFINYQSHHNSLDYFVIYGPKVQSVLNRFATIVGKPAMIPKYALGYLASSMGYAENNQAQSLIEQFPDLLDKYDIPCDLLHLSSGYTVDPQNNARNVFTWNQTRFDDPKKLFRILSKHGIKTVANVKPWLLAVHPHYDTLKNMKGFVWDPTENSASLTRLWSAGAGETSNGSYIDFSSKGGRQFWKNGIRELLEIGIEGIWNDNNEFGLHDDDHTFAMNSDLGIDHEQTTVGTLGRALQTTLMASASYEAMIEANPQKRPFLITRSSATGTQKYASQTWSGDNYTSWETLKHNIPMGLTAGLSLLPGYGHDVGGFVGPRPSPELFVRWVQSGIFHPRFCIHSWKPEGITEPWMHPDVLDIIRDAIQFRYKIIPYLYTISLESHEVGTPVMRPTMYHFQHDEMTHQQSFEYLLGPFLLVASVFEEKALDRVLYLPNGCQWCNVWTGEWFEGGQTVSTNVPLSQHGGLFAKEGAIVPLNPSKVKYVSTDTDLIRHLWVYPSPSTSGKSQFIISDDDGVSFVIKKFSFRVDMEWTSSQVIVNVTVLESNWKPNYKGVSIVLPAGDNRILIAGGLVNESFISF
ncbi:glycosyl hydrolases family 31-domain-containing protein [Globomyces pollinis-pini]|nr:glycosyl hydrolases family 31-domain-containing protein [Globomyces pollinis-pini]